MTPRLMSLAALCAGLALPCSADDRPGVFVQAKAEDAVGRRVVQGLREELRRRLALRFVETPDQATLVLHIVSMESTPGNSGVETAYSVAATLSDGNAFSGSSYWGSFVGVCGAAVTAGCARTLADFAMQAAAGVRDEVQRRDRQAGRRP